MQPLCGITRLAFLGFFSSHIVFSIIVDSQAALPTALFPEVLQQLVNWYLEFTKDPLMSAARGRGGDLLWFQSIVTAEFIFQIPFFIIACYYLATHTIERGLLYPEWFRRACIAYGAHVSTTMVPILTTIAFRTEDPIDRSVLLSLYLPYLIFPLWIMAIAFTAADGKAQKKKSQ